MIETSIGLEVLDGRDPGAPAEPQRLSAESRIEGAWALTVRLRCDGALAREFAHKLFALEDAKFTHDEVEDAFLEVANMIVGNLKAAHEGECSHSHPEIIESPADSGSEAESSSWLAPVRVFTRKGTLCLYLLSHDPQ